jgi:multiple sugar transport system substrate-binding protein
MIGKWRFWCGAVIVVAAFAGCFGSAEKPGETQPDNNPFAGQRLRAVVPKGLELPAAWKPILDEWSAQTGALYQMDEVDFPTPTQPQSSSTAARFAGSGDSPGGGLVVFPTALLAELAGARLLAPLPQDQLSEENLRWLDVFAGLREQVASLERQPTVVPISSPVLVCYYRRDLLEKAGLSPPATWSDYQKLLDTLDRWAPGLTAVEPWGEDFRATMFLARAVSYAKHPAYYSVFFDEETGAPLIDRPSFVRALADAQAALAKMPPAVAGFSPRDCRREFFTGRAALAVAFETGPGNPPLAFGPGWPLDPEAASAADSAPAAGRPETATIGFCRLPGVRDVYDPSTRNWVPAADGKVNQVTLSGFGGLCAGVSSASTPLQAQAAWNVLATLSLDNIENAFPGAAKSPSRQSQLAKPAAWVGEELTADEAQRYLETAAASLRDTRLVPELPVVGHAQFRAALTEQLGEVLAGRAEPQTALSATAEKWRQIANDLGREKVRDSYRRSLGLRPL